MLPRDRVRAALALAAPDRVPLEYHPSPSGFYEHGERLQRLFAACPDDFGPPGRFPLAAPDPAFVDSGGRYQEIRIDEWGTVWKHLFFGACGIPIEYPLAEWDRFAAWRPPPPPSLDAAEGLRAADHRRRYFLKSGWISLFERLHALRPFDDVLTDIVTDRPEIHRLADAIAEHEAGVIAHLLARGVDAVQFGDDFGTQSALMLSPGLWRRFFKPRYETLMRPIRDAGVNIFFHSCGQVRLLLDDFADLQVDAIWPQLNVYDLADLARRCRDARVAIALHPDRGDLMTRGTPGQVRAAVHHLAETFQVGGGGAWFYVEIDSGFPFANIEALVESIAALRVQ